MPYRHISLTYVALTWVLGYAHLIAASIRQSGSATRAASLLSRLEGETPPDGSKRTLELLRASFRRASRAPGQGGVAQELYIYIYIYIERERDR